MEKTITLKLTLDGKEFRAEAVLDEAAIKRISDGIEKLNKPVPTQGIKSATKEFTGMNQVIGQTGFLLSDMDMFFRSNDWATNIRIGAMSVSNNFSMIGQTAVNAFRQAQAAGMGFGEIMKTALSGSNLFLLGLNGGLIILQLFTRFLNDGTEAAKKQKDEVGQLKDAYKEYTDIMLKSMETNIQYEILQLENKGGLGSRSRGQALMQWIASGSLSEEEQTKLNDLYNKRAALQSAIQDLGDLDKIKKRIDANTKAYYGLSDENLLTNYFYLTESLQAKGLSVNANNARKILEQWINSDKELLKNKDELNRKSGDSLIMTDAEYQKQIKLTVEGLTQAKTEREKYEWKKKLIEFEKQHSGYYNQQTGPDVQNENIKISASELPQSFAEMSKKRQNEWKQEQNDFIHTAVNEGLIQDQMDKLAKDNLENVLNQGGDLALESLNKMEHKLATTRQAWQRMGDVAANMLDRIIYKSFSVEDALSMVTRILLQIGLNYLLPGSGAVADGGGNGGGFGVPGITRSIIDDGPMTRLNNITEARISSTQIIHLQVAPIEVRQRSRELYGATKREEMIIKKYY